MNHSESRKFLPVYRTALTVGVLAAFTACSPELPPATGDNEAIICDGVWDVYPSKEGVLPYDAATVDDGVIDRMGASESSLQGAIVDALLQITNNPNAAHFPDNCSVEADLTDYEIDQLFTSNEEKGNVAITVPITEGERSLLLIAPPVTSVGLNN